MEMEVLVNQERILLILKHYLELQIQVLENIMIIRYILQVVVLVVAVVVVDCARDGDGCRLLWLLVTWWCSWW